RRIRFPAALRFARYRVLLLIEAHLFFRFALSVRVALLQHHAAKVRRRSRFIVIANHKTRDACIDIDVEIPRAVLIARLHRRKRSLAKTQPTRPVNRIMKCLACARTYTKKRRAGKREEKEKCLHELTRAFIASFSVTRPASATS